jgi:hypothetical protein
MADQVVDLTDQALLTHEEIGKVRLQMQSRQWHSGRYNSQFADQGKGTTVNVGVQVVLPEADRLKLIERHEKAMLANGNAN